jgi:hypothetical protein
MAWAVPVEAVVGRTTVVGVSATIGFWDAVAVGVRLVIGMMAACVAVLFVFLLAAVFC